MEKSILEVAKDLTWLWVNIERAIPSAIFQALWSWDGPVAKIVNFMGEVWDDLISVVPNLSVNTVHNALMKNEKIRERLEAPENEGMQESMIELLTNVEMAILGKRMKGKWEKVGKTKASMIYNDVKWKIRTDVYWFSERLKSWIKTANEAADWMKQYNRTEGIEWTSMGRSNVRQATIEWFKKGFNELKESKPTEEIIKEWKIESKEITPYEQERQRQIQERKTSIVNQTKDLKISEESKTNLANNPNLQTAYTEVLKPYLEENWSNNPEWLITQQVDELVYDIRAWIDELFVQQANLTRKVWWTQKLSPMEKALIKEIQKIISNKEPKTVLKKLSKLTPAQQGIMEKIVPNLTQRITTITQLETLLNEIIKWNLIWKILKFQANRPRVTLRWALKKQVYKYISDYWDQRWIKHTIEDIDNFVSKLSEAEINDIAKWENLSESPLATKIEEWWKALWVIKAEWSEIDLYENERLKGEGYTPDTNLYTTDESWKIVEHDILNELDTKPANWWKTIREIFKEAWVNLTLPNKWIYDIRFSRWRNIAWIYYDWMDLIALPKQSAQVWVLMHEFWHRLWKQFGEDQMLKITEEIERRTWLTGKEANERFAEYMRNYFLYWNIDWKLSKDMIKDMWKDLWQKVFNQMEKTRNELLDVFGAPNNRYITETIDSVFKLTDKWKKLVQTEVESDVWQMQNFLQKNISTLEQYSESPLKVSWNNIVKQLKEQAFSDIKKIRIDEEWNVMWQYHSHEWPIASLMENRDEINLDKEVKTFLEKQAEEWENKKFEQSLENLKD